MGCGGTWHPICVILAVFLLLWEILEGFVRNKKNLKKGLKKGEVWFTMEPSGEKW